MSAIPAGLAAARSTDPVSVTGSPRAADLLWGEPCGGDAEDVPDLLGGVRIAHLVGEGGMGRVYLGHHTGLDIDVAVKVMDGRRGDRARFMTEARLAAKVQHEHVVRVLHAGDERGHRFIVMEYVAGSTLKQVASEQGRLPWRQAAAYVLQAAQGLAAAHRLGIVHRDVKPSNLLLDAQGRVKVGDLGVARTLLGESDATVTGSVIGTLAYMAPEQARDPHNVTPAADVYALGATLYMLVVGQVPYPGLAFAELLQAHRAAPPDPRRLVPDLPAEPAALIARFMARDAWNRPADGAEAAQALERLLGLATVSTAVSRPAPAAMPARRWWLAAVAATALIGTLLLAGWAAPAGDPPQPTPAAKVPDRAPPPLPVAAAPLPVADAWRTPPRAAFLIADRLPAAALASADAACAGSGLPVIERQRLDVLAREQDLLGAGRVDPATASRIGRLVGGHIAVFAAAIEDSIEVRTVLVETGELVACRLVPVERVGDAVAAGLASAAALLPVQAGVVAADGGLRLDAGARHGVRVGDRLELRREAGGAVLATAAVTAVEPGRAACAVQGADAAGLGGAFASRTAP